MRGIQVSGGLGVFTSAAARPSLASPLRLGPARLEIQRRVSGGCALSPTDLKVAESPRERLSQAFNRSVGIEAGGWLLRRSDNPLRGSIAQGSGGGLGGLSGTLTCGDLDDVIQRLRAQVDALRRLRGEPWVLQNSVATIAVRFINEWSSWWKPHPVTGEGCRNAVDRGNSILRDLNSLVESAGGQEVTVPRTEIDSRTTAEKVLDQLRGIAVPIAVVAGALVVAPIVWEAVSYVRASRRR